MRDVGEIRERGQWDEASEFAGHAGLTERDLSMYYPKAIAWTRWIFEST